jgi:hypothetical protein
MKEFGVWCITLLTSTRLPCFRKLRLCTKGRLPFSTLTYDYDPCLHQAPVFQLTICMSLTCYLCLIISRNRYLQWGYPNCSSTTNSGVVDNFSSQTNTWIKFSLTSVRGRTLDRWQCYLTHTAWSLYAKVVYISILNSCSSGIKYYILVKFEVFKAATMKNFIFLDVTPCGSWKNEHFGRTHELHHQGNKNLRARYLAYVLVTHISYLRKSTSGITVSIAEYTSVVLSVQ